eukprot:GHVT01076278.1.p1 GENE.GHVT01076278.1~~GHVT01076278.1.p1  ORF type:complete len:762 (-),score=138.53 GHVT01076278.1:2148-4433(-)
MAPLQQRAGGLSGGDTRLTPLGAPPELVPPLSSWRSFLRHSRLFQPPGATDKSDTFAFNSSAILFQQNCWPTSCAYRNISSAPRFNAVQPCRSPLESIRSAATAAVARRSSWPYRSTSHTLPNYLWPLLSSKPLEIKAASSTGKETALTSSFPWLANQSLDTVKLNSTKTTTTAATTTTMLMQRANPSLPGWDHRHYSHSHTPADMPHTATPVAGASDGPRAGGRPSRTPTTNAPGEEPSGRTLCKPADGRSLPAAGHRKPACRLSTLRSRSRRTHPGIKRARTHNTRTRAAGRTFSQRTKPFAAWGEHCGTHLQKSTHTPELRSTHTPEVQQQPLGRREEPGQSKVNTSVRKTNNVDRNNGAAAGEGGAPLCDGDEADFRNGSAAIVGQWDAAAAPQRLAAASPDNDAATDGDALRSAEGSVWGTGTVGPTAGDPVGLTTAITNGAAACGASRERCPLSSDGSISSLAGLVHPRHTPNYFEPETQQAARACKNILGSEPREDASLCDKGNWPLNKNGSSTPTAPNCMQGEPTCFSASKIQSFASSSNRTSSRIESISSKLPLLPGSTPLAIPPPKRSTAAGVTTAEQPSSELPSSSVRLQVPPNKAKECSQPGRAAFPSPDAEDEARRQSRSRSLSRPHLLPMSEATPCVTPVPPIEALPVLSLDAKANGSPGSVRSLKLTPAATAPPQTSRASAHPNALTAEWPLPLPSGKLLSSSAASGTAKFAQRGRRFWSSNMVSKNMKKKQSDTRIPTAIAELKN